MVGYFVLTLGQSRYDMSHLNWIRLFNIWRTIPVLRHYNCFKNVFLGIIKAIDKEMHENIVWYLRLVSFIPRLGVKDGLNYHLLAATEVAQWAAPCCIGPQPATDNSAIDGSSNSLAVTPTVYRGGPSERNLHGANVRINHECSSHRLNKKLNTKHTLNCVHFSSFNLQ